MRPVLRWVLLAIFATLLTGSAAVASFIHSNAAEDLATGQHDTADWQQQADHQARLATRWEWGAVAAELLAFFLWMKVAQAWNRGSQTGHGWLRYALMVVVSIAAPCALLALFFVLI